MTDEQYQALRTVYSKGMEALSELGYDGELVEALPVIHDMLEEQRLVREKVERAATAHHDSKVFDPDPPASEGVRLTPERDGRRPRSIWPWRAPRRARR
jgi:hypothetical protein